MPPKREKGRRNSLPDPNTNDDNNRSGSEEENEARHLSNTLNDQIEGLSEKRTDVREAALQKIVDGLKKQFLQEFVISNREHLLRATRAGAAAAKSILENNLSCQLFNLMAITAGFAWEEDYKTLAPFLRSLFDKLTEFEHKKEVTLSLGLITFLWCQDDMETQSLVNYFNQLLTDATTDKEHEDITPAEYEYLASLMRIIGLLLTVTEQSFVLETFFSEYDPDWNGVRFVENLENFLGCPSSELRCATGETFALICSIVRSTEEEKGDKYSCFYFNGYLSNVQDTLDQITSYANGDQKINKKDRERQSQIFTPVLQSFQKGVDPSEELTINNQTFQFSGWEDRKRLNFFREILGTGFQHHFANNQIMADIFDVFVESEFQRLTGVQKKAFLQRSARQSKLRKQSINKSRANKEVTYDD